MLDELKRIDVPLQREGCLKEVEAIGRNVAERKPWALPDTLLRYLPDSELALMSWDGASASLTLKVTKDIGPERGRLVFRGVSHVNLPPSLEISGIEIGGLAELPPNSLASYRPGDDRLDSDEHVYLIHESWGAEFFVVAEAVDYEVEEQAR